MPTQIYTVELDGTQYDLEGDHPPSEAEARAAVGGQAPKTATPPPAGATLGMMQPSTAKGDPNTGVMTEDAWQQMPVGEKVRNVGQWAGKALGGMMGMGAPGVMNPGVDAVEHPGMTLAYGAVPIALQAAGKAVPGIMEGAKRLGGVSKLRAGANLEAATAAAKDVPLNDTETWMNLSRAQELVPRGSNMPKVVRDLVTRIGDVESAPLNFDEARDFYASLGRLSVKDTASLNGPMQAQIFKIKDALGQALRDAAETGGVGEQYAKGMSEYAKAGRAATNWETKGKPLLTATLKRLAQGAGIAEGYNLGRKMVD